MVVDPVVGLAVWLTPPRHEGDLTGSRWSISCAHCGGTWTGTAQQLDEVTRLAAASGGHVVSVRLAVPPPTPPIAPFEPVDDGSQARAQANVAVSGR